MRYIALAAGVLLAASFWSVRASACAAGACGDPTLTAMGVEKPFKNRVRFALEERFGGHSTGDPALGDSAWSLRSAISGSWSPLAWLTAAALVPVVTQWLREGARPWSSFTGLGD